MDIEKIMEGHLLKGTDISSDNIRTIAVTGSNGFLGSHLVKSLKRRFFVFALIRPSTATEGFHEGCFRVHCDIRLDRSVSGAVEDIRAMRQVEAVVHLAGVRAHWYPETVFHEVNVEGTRRVVWAARELGAGQLVFASSSLVYAQAKSPYSRSKVEAERMVREGRVPYTIIRFTPIFGTGDETNITKLVQIASGKSPLPLVPVVSFGRQRIQPLFVEDAAAAIEAVLLREEHLNKEYDLSGFETDLREIVSLAKSSSGCRKPVVSIPEALARLLAKAQAKLIKHPVLSIQQLNSLKEELVFDSSMTWEKLGLERTEIADAIYSLASGRHVQTDRHRSI